MRTSVLMHHSEVWASGLPRGPRAEEYTGEESLALQWLPRMEMSFYFAEAMLRSAMAMHRSMRKWPLVDL
jgi:hypothetical protein